MKIEAYQELTREERDWLARELNAIFYPSALNPALLAFVEDEKIIRTLTRVETYSGLLSIFYGNSKAMKKLRKHYPK